MWLHRLAAAGWFPVLLPLLEGARALGPVVGHAILFGEPLLTGFIDQSFVSKMAEWLMDGQAVDRLLAQLETRPVEQEP